jgi:hypothetical protein
LLYCAQGNDPQSEKLVLPSNGWGKITAISIDQGYLYVLDPQNNAVWSYAGEKQKYLAGPRIFFNSIPEGIQTAVDIAVMDEELYMLRNDGSIIWCTFGNFECIDPAVLRDARPGRNSQEVSFPQSLFTKIETTRPPDPSLFLLSEKEKSIYHFSLQLNLQKIFAPMDNSEYPVPKNPITAFVIAPGQKLVVATANQLFSAQLP